MNFVPQGNDIREVNEYLIFISIIFLHCTIFQEYVDGWMAIRIIHY